jgi:pyruvate/2-oxoglutarate dehydrogenase complex dihydrolipoamide acyltransferase (E2) component
MQFLDGGAPGSNGRDSRAVRSSEQDPTGPEGEPGGRGSLMARYRGAGQPAPGAEDQATPPLPRTGESPGGAGATPPASLPAPGAPDNPWRQSSWTSAPPVPPAPPTPPAPPSPTPAAAGPAAAPAPTADKPADPPGADKLAGTAGATAEGRSTGTAVGDRATNAPEPDVPEPDAPAGAKAEPAAAPTPATESAAEPAVTVTRGTTPGTTSGSDALLDTDRATEFKQRWRGLQADFVDDPQQAVRGAGDLAREILQALSDTIADAERVDRWRAGDGTTGTEDLRVALRQYRRLVDRLLEL